MLSLGYEKPGVSSGKEIIYNDSDGKRPVLPAFDFAGEKDLAAVALACAEYFQRTKEGFFLNISRERLVAVKDFPKENGWFLADANTTIPHGVSMRGPSSRFLSRVRTSYDNGARAIIPPYASLILNKRLDPEAFLSIHY